MTANPQLAAWANFYVIVGSAGAAVIGVQFVVIALIASRRAGATAEAIRVFATPTVAHLGAALLVSAIMSAPWPSLFPVSVALTLCGLGGLAYGTTVIHRARGQTTYGPCGRTGFGTRYCRAASTPSSRWLRYSCARRPRSRCSYSGVWRSDCCSSASTMPGTR